MSKNYLEREMEGIQSYASIILNPEMKIDRKISKRITKYFEEYAKNNYNELYAMQKCDVQVHLTREMTRIWNREMKDTDANWQDGIAGFVLIAADWGNDCYMVIHTGSGRVQGSSQSNCCILTYPVREQFPYRNISRFTIRRDQSTEITKLRYIK